MSSAVLDRIKHVVMDLVAIFTPALLVLMTQLESGELRWPPLAAAAIGALVSWSRTGTGGLRADPKPESNQKAG